MLKKLIRFLIVGGISTIINYLTFFILLKNLGVNYLTSSGIGYILGLGLGFFLNKVWTFNCNSKSIALKIKYFIVYMVNLGISLILLKYLSLHLNINPMIGNIVSIIYTTIFNFIGINKYVFGKKKERSYP
jgi:putative flippase GtrA